jgi:hypothetical protein
LGPYYGVSRAAGSSRPCSSLRLPLVAGASVSRIRISPNGRAELITVFNDLPPEEVDSFSRECSDQGSAAFETRGDRAEPPVLVPNDPAMLEMRTIFPSTVGSANGGERVLKVRRQFPEARRQGHQGRVGRITAGSGRGFAHLNKHSKEAASRRSSRTWILLP